MSKVIHFEIPADDPERAMKFYKDVFGWEIEKWEQGDYWLVSTGPDEEPGINGAIMPRESGDMVRNTISVDSYEEFAEKIEGQGGKMLTEKMTIPGMGFNGLFQDTEGNMFGIIEVTMIFITQIFNSPLKDLWRIWTEPESIMKWWGPKDFTAPVVKNDLKEGGSYLYCMRSPEGEDFWSTGVYKEVVPMERIVATDSFADSEGNVVPASHYGMTGDWPLELNITVTFEEENDKTKLTIQHQGFPDHENRDLAEEGWKESLNKLDTYLKTLK
jgi:predicted enzyme related to lactoylglutathione lyase/uncharacterized protein YndB with AHSA1/START domain